MIISENGEIMYFKAEFDSEEEVEQVVLKNYQLLFGNYSLLLPKAKVSTLSGKSSIPDGIVVNFESKEWFIIEVERGMHGTWAHIAPQISKQITAFSNRATEEKVKNLYLQEISRSKEFKDLLYELDITELEIHGCLNEIFKSDPIVAIPIDEIPTDLNEWAETLKHDVRIWVIGKYISNGSVVYTLPDESVPNIATGSKKDSAKSVTQRLSNAWSMVIEKGLLKEGDQVLFDYGPKGVKKKHFTGIVRKNGIEVDGVVSSPSISSLRCIQTLSPTRTSSNGWVTWKTGDGEYIDKLYQMVQKILEEETEPFQS